MTIIAGFPVTGFVVLGADTEEGSAVHKAAVRKIEPLIGEGYCCFVGGAGGSNFIDQTIQEAREAISELNPPTLEDIRTTLEYVTTEVYTDRIDKLPAQEADDARFELLCAVWTAKDQRAELVRIGRGYSLVRHRPDVVGLGDYLASYLIETLRQDAGRRQAERLCAYILAKCKAHVQGCGGASQIIVLADDGKVQQVPQFVITEDEIAADILMGGFQMLFNWTDIIGWGGRSEKIDEVVEGIAKTIKEGFQNRLEQLKANAKVLAARPIPESPMHDSPALPPSPESPEGTDES